MGGVLSVACQGFLVREACVGVLVGGAGFLLSGMQWSARNGLRDIKGFGIILSCLYIEAQGSVPVLLENLRGMSCSGTCWPLGDAWFQCKYGGI